jgi:ubiquitin-activating enzyme E1
LFCISLFHIAKNLVLAGVRSVTVHDNEPVQLSDLSAQFYFTQADIGRNRSEVCVPRLAELNPYVSVLNHTGDLSTEFVEGFQAVVMTNNHSLEELKRINLICHHKHIVFVIAEARGLFGYIFTDFGEEFTVVDTNGEEPQKHIVTSVTQVCTHMIFFSFFFIFFAHLCIQ